MSGELPYGSLGGKPLVSCARILREFMQAGLDYSTFYRRANSYRCTLGAEPGYAWILMQASELRKLDSRQPQSLILGIEDAIEIPNLVFIQSQRILSSPSSNPDSLHLVQLADVRYLLKQTVINKRYNIIQPCSAVDADYCEGTTNSGTPWTFEEIVEDIWGYFNAFGGFFPYADFNAEPVIFGDSPTVDPDNLRFEGISAWDALQQLCQIVGYYIRFDPLLTKIRVIKIGEPDTEPGEDGDLSAGWGGAKKLLSATTLPRFATTPSSIVRNSSDSLIDDAEVFLGTALVPEKVCVCFRTNDENCGEFCEIDDNDSHGWYYIINVVAGTARSTLTGDAYRYLDYQITATSVVVYSTALARFALSSDTMPDNYTDLETIAIDLATSYYRNIGDHANGRIIYEGIKKFKPGPHITEVAWREWGDGLKTEVARRQQPIGVAKPNRITAAGGGTCDSQNEIWDISLISATSGTYDLYVVVNSVGEWKTFDFDGSAADFATELATHAEITSSDVDVTGGDHPKITIRVEFIAALANTYILHPMADATNLNSSAGVIVAQAQKGHA